MSFESRFNRFNNDVRKNRQYRDSILDTLNTIGRTVNGRLNLSANSDKLSQFVTLDQDDVQKKLNQNLEKVIQTILNDRSAQFSSFKEVDVFVQNLFRQLNSDILTESSFLRTGQQKHNRVAETSIVPELYYNFIEYLFQIFNQKLNLQDDIQRIAGTIVYKVLRDHYFIDGCGKMSILLSSYYLIRNGQRLPRVPNKSAFSVNPEYNEFYKQGDENYTNHLNTWLQSYASLFIS